MKIILVPIVFLLGSVTSKPVTLIERQFASSFPDAAQAPPQYQVQQKASGALIQKAWAEVGQQYKNMIQAEKCVSAVSPSNPPPNLLLNCGVGEAHKAIANKLWETTTRFAPNSPINYLDAGTAMVTASGSLVSTQQTAFKAINSNWAVSVRSGERQLVYESLVQQLGLYETWAKAYNGLMPTGTKTMGDGASTAIVTQYKALIKKYQWDISL